ncbi:MAG: SGNH/GDSL hydrolase family protein [Saprospiraceae bacterium]|nr:SGNH/GDSL hydrolase family protein [Saprospiraceae bacterium]
MMRFFAFNLLLFSIFMLSFRSKTTRVVFFGDSITQAGVQPGGYIAQMKDSLVQKNKAPEYELIGAGIGGNKVYDLFLRLEPDVLNKKPDLVFLYVGVNDVWHKRSFGTGTDAPKFVQFYEALIQKITQNGARVVLCTPACIGEKTDFSNPLDGELNQYAQLIRDIALKSGLPVVDLRKAFLDYNLLYNLKNQESGILTTDGVHLNEKGNQLLAQLMLPYL